MIGVPSEQTEAQSESRRDEQGTRGIDWVQDKLEHELARNGTESQACLDCGPKGVLIYSTV